MAVLQSPVVRLGGLLLLAVLAIAAFSWGVGALTPTVAGDRAEAQATPYATLYVACTAPDCRASHTTHQTMDFDGWPLVCEQCGRASVYRATRCPRCGKWFATAPQAEPACPSCTQPEVPDETPAAETDRPTDDEEDFW